MADFDTKLSVSGVNSPFGISTDVSLRDVIAAESGDAAECLWGDGTFRAPTGGGGGSSVQIGGYTIFVDTDGSLKIKAPDGSVTPLVIKT